MPRRKAHTNQRTSPNGPETTQRFIVSGVRRRRDQLVELAGAEQSEALVADTAIAVIRAKRVPNRFLLIAATDERVSRLESAIQRMLQGEHPVSIARLGQAGERGTEKSRRPTIVVASSQGMIDRLRRDDSSARSFTLCLIDATLTERAEQFGADLQFIYAKLRSTPVSVAFVPESWSNLELLMELLRRPAASVLGNASDSASSHRDHKPIKEQTVSDFPFDKSEFKTRISEILREIHEEEDPIEMTRIKRMVRRHTSVFNRGYIIAYLLKQTMSNGSRPRKKRAEKSPTNEDQQSVFVSIGRNRRVHTRDLITFFTSVDGITSEDIGQIKVLDNYSFVEVNKDKAQAAIEALNGQELRGRKLTVNFARRK